MNRITFWDGPIVEFDMTAPVPQDHPASDAIQTTPGGLPTQAETPAPEQSPVEPRVWPGVLIAVVVTVGTLLAPDLARALQAAVGVSETGDGVLESLFRVE